MLLKEIKKLIKKNSFCVLSTISSEGKPHTVGMIYYARGLDIYILTGRQTKKVQNISINPQVAVVIQVPYIFRFIPPRVIQFQGRAEILPITDPTANKVYKWRIPQEVDGYFIHIQPERKIWTHGIGMSMIKRARHPEKAERTITIT
ncbi:MAG: pyridoxamine 5'-phosphate oxidase family protein [archaeon]|nr:pyridoxamine 5'-phosphate oxidase family protein [archaeon]MCP8306717.1 pyridoxamine 5'-phosphate oxidase family protein [archaeon]